MKLLKNRYGEMRSGWHLAIGVALSFGLAMLLQLVAGFVMGFIGISTASQMLGMLLQYGGMVGGCMLAFYLCTGHPVVQLGFSPAHIGKKLVHGLLAGLLPFTAVYAILVLTGQLRITAVNLSVLGTVNWWSGLPLFIMVGIGEEVLCRGSMMTAFKPCRNKATIMVLPALLFSLLHFMNPDFSFLAFFNILLAGLFFALLFLRTGSLWAPIAGHFAWNWVQGCVYGVNVSGMGLVSFIESAPVAGGDLWHGGGFGAEGGLVTSLVLLAGIVLYLFVFKTAPNAKWTLESDLPFVRSPKDRDGENSAKTGKL